MLKKVDRILVRVPQLASAITYYRDTLGLHLLRNDHRLATFRLAGSDAELVLHSDADLPDQGIYYLVEDVKDLYERRAELRLTFVTPPHPVSRGHAAVAKDPFGNVLQLLDRTADHPHLTEDAKPAGTTLFAGIEARSPSNRNLLIQMYEKTGRTADDLPYTPHFESLYMGYVEAQAEPKPTRAEVWRHLLNLRKGGKLAKLGPAKSPAPEVTPEDRERLRAMLGEDAGRRDRLPYTDRFNELVDHFNRTTAQAVVAAFGVAADRDAGQMR